jgi:hypothetical protein
MLGIHWIGWMILLFGAFLFVRATIALRTGKIYFGWAFDTAYAHRDKEPLSYWYTVIACYLGAVFCTAIICYGILFPTT